jgi:PAS domain S-box-containing protein
MPTSTPVPPELLALFDAGGEMGLRCQSFPWEDSALGSPATWPAPLRTIIRTVLESPFPMSVMCGPELVQLYNDAFRALLGSKHPAALGKGSAETWQEVWDEVAPMMEEVQRGGATLQESARFLVEREHGQPREAFFTFSVSPVRDDDGRVIALLSVGMETTAQIQAEREAAGARATAQRVLDESDDARRQAEANEERFRFLASSIPVQVWSATPDGALDFVSERTRESLGLAEHQLLGSGWLDALHPDDVARSTERWMQSVRTGDAYETEFRIWSDAHQAYRWHLVRASAQRDTSGNIVRWFGTNTDIEDAKQAQEELQRLTLEAQHANRSKSDFLAAMSHELRTPLNAIGGYAQLLELGVRGPVTPEQKDDLRRIQRSKAHLDGLVSGVLDFAKVGAGHIELRPTTIKVDAMIASVVEMIVPQLEEKGLSLTAVGASPRATMVGDAEKTRQILLNLLANALKFTLPGGTIRIDFGEAPGMLLIRVADTGIGIADDQLERVFEPFVQAKSELHVAGIGVGLGLAISRQLARAMGGDITVTSTLGTGSTFTLAMPSA